MARGKPIEYAGRTYPSISSLAAAIGEERDTIEDVLEPYLIQQGFLMRTSRGRTATKTAYLHFGMDAPKMIESGAIGSDKDLFDEECAGRKATGRGSPALH